MCVVLTVGVSVGVVGDGASEVERGGGRAMLVVSCCVTIGEEEEGEGEGEDEGEEEGVAGKRMSEGEGVDAMRGSTVELSLKKSPELVTFMNTVILSMSVILSVGSTEGVGEMVGENACVEVGLGIEDVSFWARMTGHRTRRRRRRGEGKESSSDRTIFNLQRGGGEKYM